MSKIKDSVLAFALGDAMGVPVEHKKREDLLRNPVTTMTSGKWSDDTSLLLATMDSIIKCKRLDYKDMADRLCLYLTKGEYTCPGETVKTNDTTKKALDKYLNDDINPVLCGGKGIYDNDNGSLMRMLPIALYAYYTNLKDDEVYRIVKNTSSITHANDVSVLGCFIYVLYTMFLLNGKDKYASYNMIRYYDYSVFFDPDTVEYFNRLLKTNIAKIRIEDLKSESYIVYTLETILWVTLNCNSLAESIVGAINLGGDTDTIGATSGSIAGILYGTENVPANWTLDNRQLIDEMIRLFEEELGVYD